MNKLALMFIIQKLKSKFQNLETPLLHYSGINLALNTLNFGIYWANQIFISTSFKPFTE